MEKSENRFIDVKKLQGLLAKKERIETEINSVNSNSTHCRDCGDTKPEHGFYPLLGMTVGEGIYQTSMFICNRCALTDEEYLERFDEPKEIIS